MEDGGAIDVDVPDQLPARMINEFAYCPRLFYLEYVEREWAHSADTLDGRFVHRRVDQQKGRLPAAEGLEEDGKLHARSITVGSERLGAIACIDVLEGEGTRVTPVDYKRGSPPDLPDRAWEPERVQVCLQGLLLRENGYDCDEGVLYFAASRARVPVLMSDALIARTLELLAEARRVAGAGQIPPPLWDSPKCPRCSLAGICLPDEINLLRQGGRAGEPMAGACDQVAGADDQTLGGKARRHRGDGEATRSVDETVVVGEETQDSRATRLGGAAPEEARGIRGEGSVTWEDAEEEARGIRGEGSVTGEDAEEEEARGLRIEGEAVTEPVRPASRETRRLTPARDDRVPLYVQGQGYSLGLKGEVLEVREKGSKVDDVRLMDLSQVSLFGNVQVSAQALRELMAREILVIHLSYGGWLNAITSPPTHKNIGLRQRQFEAAANPATCLTLARAIVSGKIRNCRTLLRRNAKELPERVLPALADARQEAERASSLASLLGIEGNAAREYFGHLPCMLKAPEGEVPGFDFQSRNRRPPKDPVNAMLSYVYALLTKDLLSTLVAVGFDPYLGYYHQPRYGRPALALDLMEEFRPLIGDSVVIGLINNGEVKTGDFVTRGGACALTPDGRRRVIDGYERRMDGLVTHPLFGYTLSYRRVLEVQVRLLARFLTGEIASYPPFCTR